MAASAARYASWCTGGIARSSPSAPSASAAASQVRPVVRTAAERGSRASVSAGAPTSSTVNSTVAGQSQTTRSSPEASRTWSASQPPSWPTTTSPTVQQPVTAAATTAQGLGGPGVANGLGAG